jgi:excisionase family DNA binding protein
MGKNGSKEISIEEILRLKNLDVDELSCYIRRSSGAIRKMVLRRQIPFHKPAGRLLFDREEIDQWVRES